MKQWLWVKMQAEEREPIVEVKQRVYLDSNSEEMDKHKLAEEERDKQTAEMLNGVD